MRRRRDDRGLASPTPGRGRFTGRFRCWDFPVVENSVVRRGDGGKLDVAELQVGGHAEVRCGCDGVRRRRSSARRLLAVLEAEAVEVDGPVPSAPVDAAEIDDELRG